MFFGCMEDRVSNDYQNSEKNLESLMPLTGGRVRSYGCPYLSIVARHVSTLLSVNDTSNLFIHSTAVVPSVETAPGGRVNHSSRGTAKKAWS
jgi:hypothetical protein